MYTYLIQARCIACIPPKEVCMHLATFRLVDAHTPPADRREIPDVSAYELVQAFGGSTVQLDNCF